MSSVSANRVKEKAFNLGFNLVGITPAQPSPHLDAYLRWIDQGMHGSMGYLARPDRVIRRRDLRAILPDARSLIIVARDYHTLPSGLESLLRDPSRGRLAAYAWGLDYHDILAPRLESLADWLRSDLAPALNHRVYVDTGAILERSHAQQAGLGFIGKNTMLIHPRRGSYFFLGEILTDLEFDDYDQPLRETMCGHCTRCQTACPTAAFPRPYVLDARRCISYLTIEHKGWIDRNLRPLMGNWIMGCDVCQEVCPFTRFATRTDEPAFIPTNANEDMADKIAPSLLELLQLDQSRFDARFKGTPVMRLKRDRLVRNACIAAGNWGDPQAIVPLQALLGDLSPVVRGHAAWAVQHILRHDANPTLEKMLTYEVDPEVRQELESLLEI